MKNYFVLMNLFSNTNRVFHLRFLIYQAFNIQRWVCLVLFLFFYFAVVIKSVFNGILENFWCQRFDSNGFYSGRFFIPIESYFLGHSCYSHPYLSS